MKIISSNNNPETLFVDDAAKVFYLLKDETLLTVLPGQHLNQHKFPFLSAGTISPRDKKIIFWPNPINPTKALNLLQEKDFIDPDYDCEISSDQLKTTTTSKRVKESNAKPHNKRLREITVERLQNQGMRLQGDKDQEDKE